MREEGLQFSIVSIYQRSLNAKTLISHLSSLTFVTAGSHLSSHIAIQSTVYGQRSTVHGQPSPSSAQACQLQTNRHNHSIPIPPDLLRYSFQNFLLQYFNQSLLHEVAMNYDAHLAHGGWAAEMLELTLLVL